MNITVWSYVGQVNISVIADDQTMNDPHEATDAMIRAFNAVCVAAGLAHPRRSSKTALAPAYSAPQPATVAYSGGLPGGG